MSECNNVENTQNTISANVTGQDQSNKPNISVGEPNTIKANDIKAKSKKIAKVFTYASMAATMAMLGISLVPAAEETVNVEYENIEVSDDSLTYFITLDGKDTSDITISLENDFENYTLTLKDDKAQGTIENLKSNMSYKIKVKQKGLLGESVISKYEIKTKKSS